MKQLYKQGLRRCKDCKLILSLDEDNFYTSISEPRGFSYRCIPCEKKYKKTDRYKKYHINWIVSTFGCSVSLQTKLKRLIRTFMVKNNL